MSSSQSIFGNTEQKESKSLQQGAHGISKYGYLDDIREFYLMSSGKIILSRWGSHPRDAGTLISFIGECKGGLALYRKRVHRLEVTDSFRDELSFLLETERKLHPTTDVLTSYLQIKTIHWQGMGFDEGKKEFMFDALMNQTYFFHDDEENSFDRAIREFFYHEHLGYVSKDKKQCLLIDDNSTVILFTPNGRQEIVPRYNGKGPMTLSRALVSVDDTVYLVQQIIKAPAGEIQLYEWDAKKNEFQSRHRFKVDSNTTHRLDVKFVFAISDHELIFILSNFHSGLDKIIKFNINDGKIDSELNVKLSTNDCLRYRILSQQEEIYLLAGTADRNGLLSTRSTETELYLLDVKKMIFRQIQLPDDHCPVGFMPNGSFVTASQDVLNLYPNPCFADSFKASSKADSEDFKINLDPLLDPFISEKGLKQLIQQYASEYTLGTNPAGFCFKRLTPPEERPDRGDEKPSLSRPY